MSWLQVKNNAEGSLNGAITDVAASMVVASAVPFPTSTPFRLTIEDEIVEVTNIAGTTFTITRGVEGTTGAAHADATPVYLNVLASHIQQLQNVVYRVYKTADQLVNNSTTLVDDLHLKKTLVANEICIVELTLLLQGGSVNADFKVGWAYPVGCVIRWGWLAGVSYASYVWETFPPGSTAKILAIQTDTDGIGGVSGINGAVIRAIVFNGANAGTLQFKWAQYLAVAEDSKILLGSCLEAKTLSP